MRYVGTSYSIIMFDLQHGPLQSPIPQGTSSRRLASIPKQKRGWQRKEEEKNQYQVCRPGKDEKHWVPPSPIPFITQTPILLHAFTPVHDSASFMSFQSFAVSPARAKGYNYITKRRFVSRSSAALVKHVFPLIKPAGGGGDRALNAAAVGGETDQEDGCKRVEVSECSVLPIHRGCC